LKRIIPILLLACSVSCQKKEEIKPVTEIVAENTPQQLLEIEVSRVPGGSFPSVIELKGDTANIVTKYNYNVYKLDHPNSSLDEKSYYEYFNTDRAYKKSLNKMPIEIFRKLPNVNNVKYKIAAIHEDYEISINRQEFENYIGGKPETFEAEWTKKVSDPITYDDAGRDRFFKKFGKYTKK